MIGDAPCDEGSLYQEEITTSYAAPRNRRLAALGFQQADQKRRFGNMFFRQVLELALAVGDLKYRGSTTGAAAGICRQHNGTKNGRVNAETPAKKKPRLA